MHPLPFSCETWSDHMSQPKPSVEDIFFAVLEMGTPDERAAYFDKVCGNDQDLRQRVERLLKAELDVGNFLEFDAAAALTPDDAQTICNGPETSRFRILRPHAKGG